MLASGLSSNAAFRPVFGSQTGCRRSVRPQHITIVVVRADSGGFNPFRRKDGDQQDAAKKALQDAFQGKKNVFKDAEDLAAKRANREEWSGDWRSWLTDARQGLVGFIKFVASSTLFVLVLASFALWKPALQSIAKVFRWAFRLDSNPRARLKADEAAPEVDLSKSGDELGASRRGIVGNGMGLSLLFVSSRGHKP
ncbi:hypothetical protein F751_6758 [Auxenochlorella protothecoides]|uniref:Uncharacterized protein n=1 Tax=Auxenochlorella protothecoides TaxID=3075 RepID=A0A087SAH3_AUXPR|nr:hypothetical protein F751_6758 [Auxenochlorella protothecoides]KFM22727.1 hypothetical protein F751_6758 [Auxenochlorella protothecoides]